MIVGASAGTIMVMTRAAPLVLGSVALLLGGCPEEPVPAGEGSTTEGSTGLESSTTRGGSSTGELDTTAGTSSTVTDTSTTATDSTTGEPGGGEARFVVRQRVEDSEDLELVLLEYADGELQPPISLTPGLPPGGGVGVTMFTESGRVLAYCTFDPAMMTLPCYAIDLTTHPPGPAQPMISGPVPANTLLSAPSWIEATETFVYRTHDASDVVPDEIYSAAFSGGVLQVPEVVAQAGPGESIDGNKVRVHADGAWVGYVIAHDAGPHDAFVAPLDPPDPSAAVMVSDLGAPELRASPPSFVPGREAVIYSIDDDPLPGPTDDSLWFVDISGPMPTAPLRVDDPLTDVLDVRGPELAPDGHALVYWAGDSLDGDLLFVDLASGLPEPPVLVSTLGAEQTVLIRFGWSPDSRYVAYLAAHEQPDTYDLHLVEASGDAPGEPMLATGGIISGGEVLYYRFDSSSSWLYYVAQQEGPEAQMYRVDLTGPEPGAPQRVSGRIGTLTGEIIGSLDWTSVLYTLQEGGPSDRQLYLVDVAGADPGEPVRVDTPLAADVRTSFGSTFSRDGSVVLYRQEGPTNDDPTPLQLVDLVSGAVLLASEDAQAVEAVVD